MFYSINKFLPLITRFPELNSVLLLIRLMEFQTISSIVLFVYSLKTRIISNDYMILYQRRNAANNVLTENIRIYKIFYLQKNEMFHMKNKDLLVRFI